MPRAYVGLGSNVGDREAMLRAALARLGEEEHVAVVAVSRFRETAPVGIEDQPPFLNAAAAVETTLSPRELLGRLLAIERSLGRTRDGPRFGPRTIDLDLLLYDDLILDAPELTLPHPRLHDRAFVLVPLAEIAPSLVHPSSGRTIADLLTNLPRPIGVRPFAATLVSSNVS